MLNLDVNLSPVFEQLQGMGERTANTVREAAFKGAKLVLVEAYQLAPQSKQAHWFYSRRHKNGQVGKKYLFQPGSLKKSIYIKHIDELQIKGEKEVYQISWRKNSSQLGYVPYAHMVEYGTVRKAGEPFVRPAFDAKKDEAQALMLETVMRAINNDRT